jgi:Flp pilus assembly protein TadD
MAENLQSEHDDENVRHLLKPLRGRAAPVDSDRLAKLAEESLREFAAARASANEGTNETQIAVAHESPRLIVLRGDSKMRRNGMFALATRAVVSVTALVIGAFAWFFAGVNAEADFTLGDVLDATRKAKSLQLKVVRDGDVADVWMSDGGRLRWESSPTSYQIADGTSLWEIDEDANTARPATDKLLASAASDHDLLALIGVGEDGSALLRKAKPIGTVLHDGAKCRLYRMTTTIGERKLMFEAFVDEGSDELRSIVAWPAGLTKREGPPVAEVRLVARNVEVKKGQFEWAKSLSEDGRIGKIADQQGIVLLRPKLQRRWTPICRQLRLKPGDQLRTDVRGANAVSARLTSGAVITVGPGSLLELTSPKAVRLHYGEAQITGGKEADIQIHGRDKLAMKPDSDEAVLYAVRPQSGLRVIEKKPTWLLGFEGASSNESIGSLITKVDGRDVPLTIGYHKVKVEIRDQIARTTIEESFVNRTKTRLEGIFHFPLPQDASISGFGMWINGELVEADVVEKQRAREIYETILREKRDPGLLEWTGGNIFKARVFPIEPHSEKRIKIVYTQVLPLRANQYRYSYALRSEMLQKTPLRELSIDVLVHSALPLKKVESPTHPARIEQTERSASVSFSAQEYSPTQDFELVCDLDGKTSDVVTIPHRRGDDGYFMVQLSPPAADGNWQREVLPDGEPIDLLLLCDTSGSMDSANRKTQSDFVAAVLSSLGEDDRFNIAVTDADTKWLFKKSVSPDGKNVEQTRSWLDDRVSLGWTDLDQTFASIQKRVGKKTHVVYVGDGVVAARDVNAQEFAARVRRLYGKKSKGTFHAVSTGSSFESVVLKAIASLGRGSVRSIGSGQTSMSVALELLNEMAQPGLRDLNVQFRGIDVAAVYPNELPNLAAGTQQILVGRYLPSGEDQSGEIVVTGTRGGERVTYSSRISLKDAEKGNSFVPRLWARAHLDQLLQQGRSQFIKDEIISLSEEFHIITPYTSLLVLESDADRKRFGVKRRFEMRDGERFFADGRDAANYELLQKVIREAGNWRLGLRHQILRELAKLGRDPQTIQQVRQLINRNVTEMVVSGTSSVSGLDWFSGDSDHSRRDGSSFGSGGFGGGGGLGGDSGGFNGKSVGGRLFKEKSEALPVDLSPVVAGASKDLGIMNGGQGIDFDSIDEEIESEERRGGKQVYDLSISSGLLPMRKARQLSSMDDGKGKAFTSGFGLFGRSASPVASGKPYDYQYQQMIGGKSSGYYTGRNYVAWLQTLFPNLPDPAVDFPVKESKSDWPKEAVKLSQSLLRNEWLRNLKGGLEIRLASDSFDPRWKRQTGHSDSLELYSGDAWLNWSVSGGNGRTIHWYDSQQRGAISEVFHLGRVRDFAETDKKDSIGIGASSFGEGLHVSYRGYDVKIVNAPGVQQLFLTNKGTPKNQMRFSIDVEKHVIVKWESIADGKVTATTTRSDFVEIQGAWWPRKAETVDAKGRVVSRSTTVISEHSAEGFSKRHDEELAIREQVQFLKHPVPSIEDSETAVKDGSAGFAHRLALIVRFSQIQKWDEVLKQLAELEEIVGDKPGRQWIRLEVLKSARRNAEALAQIQSLAEALADAEPADLARAQHLISSAWTFANANETLKLQGQLKPVFDRQPEYAGAKWTWQGHQISSLRNLSRTEELLVLEKTHAEQQPWAVYTQVQYARDLESFGDHRDAYAWLKAVVEHPGEWHPHERDYAWRSWADLLNERGESAAQIEVIGKWILEEPLGEEPYSRYLTAYVFDDQVDEVRRLVLQWLEEGRVDGELSPTAKSKVGAAINYAMGNGWRLYWHNVEPEWFGPLQITALFYMHHEKHREFATRIMNQHQFSNSDFADEIRVKAFDELLENAATMESGKLGDFVHWVRGGKPVRDTEAWTPIAETLRKRWDELKHPDDKDEPDEKHAVGSTLMTLYGGEFHDTLYYPFIRERIAQAPARLRDTYVSTLFQNLRGETWTEEREDELFSLLAELSKNEPETQLGAQIEAAHHLVDRMIEARIAADEKELQDTGHPEELTRQEVAAKKAGFKKAAREGVAARLDAESKKYDGLPGQWLQMDRMFLDVKLSRNLEAVAKECQAILGDEPPKTDAPEKNAPEKNKDATPEELAKKIRENLVEAALRQRALVTFTNLSVRQSATPEMQKWLLAYVDAGIDRADDNSAGWKQLKYSLLIVLDQPEALEQLVRNWIRTDEYVTNWRRMLAQLMAERGELDEAISLFERIEKDSQLAPADYSALADWYLARDHKEDFRRAKIEALKAVQEYQLQNYISQRRSRWGQSDQPLPSELDEQVLFAFQALFEKSGSPGSYLSELKNFYRACRDFRLLRMIPDAVVGRTPQQVYHFLGQLRTTVLVDMRKEATADEILGRVAELRKRELTAIDRRALDLLEALIERRSAEVLNQPGPHIAAATTALKRAFEHEWADGEGRQMAEFLDGLGHIGHEELSAEQFRQLRELHRREEAGTDDRLFTGWYLANTLFHPYGKRPEGLQRMEIAIREYDETHPDGWPTHSNTPLSGYLSMLERLNRHSDSEKDLQRRLNNPLNSGQRNWLIERLTTCYSRALEAETQVTLGQREELYLNLIPFIVKQEIRADDNLRYQILQRVREVFRTAKRKKYPTLRKDMRKFAFATMPKWLKRQRNNYSSMIDQTSYMLKELLDARISLEFLIERIENYPRRFHRSYESPWNRFGYRIGDYRQQVRPLGDLEPRLLALVLAELRRDLESRNNRGRYLYRRYNNYWSEKTLVFAKTAEEVLADHRDSARFVQYIAGYLWDGLGDQKNTKFPERIDYRDRAIEVMFEAHRAKLLDDSGQAKLVDWLHHYDKKRYAESIAILEGLIERNNLSMHYRCELITAYHHTQRATQRSALVKETIELFRKDGRWNESNLRQLAQCVHDNNLHQRTVHLVGELIPMHQRSHPTRGIGEGTLSTYYMWLADAHSNLKHTKEAVDAAAAAIVAWGPRIEQRRSATQKLDAVTSAAADLDEYVTHLDKQAKESGEDSSIIRRSIGKAYFEKRNFEKAIAQLKIAVELQPGDLEIHKALIAAYDGAEDAAGASRQLLALIDIDRHNLENYMKLAERLKDDEGQAERAATSILEAAPGEAEHHAALATIRSQQKRYAEAVVHWQQVAQLRSLEPTGLINLSKAQLLADQPAAAQNSIDKLQKTDWPSRFDDPVRNALRELDQLRQAP